MVPASSSRQLRVGMVVGEASGDILGAGLMQAIQKLYPNATFDGVGGPLMIAQGFKSLYDQERLAVMGLVEPLKRLPELLRMRKNLVKHFTSPSPDVFIGIDSPDFNLDLEWQLKRAGIKTVHYVSPSVWAWRQGRIKKIAKAVDLMLTLLPFEAEFYRQHNVAVNFVGHPLADQFPLGNDLIASCQDARDVLKISAEDLNGRPVIALLPGSRGGEVKLLGTLLLQVASWCRVQGLDAVYLIPAANAARKQQLQLQLEPFSNLDVRLLDGQSHLVMSAADAVVMASGTTTLEALLLKKPMVVVYKMAALSYAIISRLVKSKYVALPNLLADRQLVPELIQDQATVNNIGKELLAYFDNPAKVSGLQQDFTAIHQQLRQNASEKAAHAVLELLDSLPDS